MSKGIFTTKPASIYDDLPELRYHFPRTYLNQVREIVNDWIIYYEPRRSTDSADSTGGTQSYFATARVTSIEPDRDRENHYYAFVDDYLEFPILVPFREETFFYEAGLRKQDGSTNKGAFGRAVRQISDQEYEMILSAGFGHLLDQENQADAFSSSGFAEEGVHFKRPISESMVRRPFRDQAFRTAVRLAYDSCCAMTRMKILNGQGRPEVQAAHIKPVASDGPDSIRNGIALSGTIHWMFDRGLLSVDDNYKILLARDRVPKEILKLLGEEKKILLPRQPQLAPHPNYLEFHRENIFKG